MASKVVPFKVQIKDKDLKSLLRSFKKMDEIAKVDLKQVANDLATEAASAVGSALSATARGEKIANSIVVSKSDRAPSFKIGGVKVKFKNGEPVGAAIMGHEFGAYQNRTRQRKGKSKTYVGYRQFDPRSPREGRGNAGYYIFPTLKAFQPTIYKRYIEQVDRIIKEWKERS